MNSRQDSLQADNLCDFDEQSRINGIKRQQDQSRNLDTDQYQNYQNTPTSQKQQQQQKRKIPRPRKEQKQIQDHDEAPAYSKGITNMPVQEFDDNFDEANLIECSEGCGRKFTQDVLDKHTMVCRKVFQEKRKKFDIKKQRLAEIDQNQILQKKNTEDIVGKKNNWKNQSEGFRAMMKLSKGQTITEEEQNAINQVQKNDKIECESCGRQFNEAAGKRHIPFCQEKSRKMNFKGKGVIQKLKAN